MNWLLIVVLLILIIGTCYGYHRGFLRIVYSLISWILIFMFVSWSTPYIAGYLTEHTEIPQQIKTKCEERLKASAEEKVSEEGSIASETALEELGISLPDSVLEKIQEQTAGTAGEILEQSGIYNSIAETLTEFIVKGIAFFIALILAIIVSCVIQMLLGIVGKLPLIHGLNQKLGILAGALYGMVFIWIGMYLIALCYSSDVGRSLYSYIQESSLLTILYQNNPLLSL